MTRRTIITGFLSLFLGTVLVLGAIIIFENIYSPQTSILSNIPIVSSLTNVPTKPDTQTFLLLGVGGEGHDGGSLTDTIMIAQVDNRSSNIHLISIPRDFLVFDDEGYYSKINAVYANTLEETGSEQESIQALEDILTEITGIQIDQYVRIDFQGFEKLIDTIGGVEVNVPEAIDDPYYPGPNYSYDPFRIEPGIQVLDGKTALKYARSRYTSAGGDLDRSRRQQQVIEAVRDKVFTLNPLWDSGKVISLLNIVNSTVDTDIPLTDMKKLYDMYKDTQDYQTFSLVIGQDLVNGVLKEGYRQFGSNRGYVLEPRAGEKNYLEIQEEIQAIQDQESYRSQAKALRSEKRKVGIVFDSAITKDDQKDIEGFLGAKGISYSIIPDDTFQTLVSQIPVVNTLYTITTPFDSVDTSQQVVTDSSELTISNLTNPYLLKRFQATESTNINENDYDAILYIIDGKVYLGV